MTTNVDEKRPPPSIDSTEIVDGGIIEMDRDEALLARLGYKQEFFRHLGFFESWAVTFTSLGTVTGIPVLFGYAMTTGGPTPAFANWTMTGGLSSMVALSMSEIAAALPTAGGIYFWSYRLGGEKYGPFLSWMTAWWNWVGWVFVIPGIQYGSTNFLLGAIELAYPNTAFVRQGWFTWLLTSIGIFLAMLPNIISPRVLKLYFRFAVICFFTLFILYWTWFPIRAAKFGHFQSAAGVFDNFYNGINFGVNAEGETIVQASNSYTWIVNVLYGAWVFFGYDASAHLAEETTDASITVARGMYYSTLMAWLMSVPTLLLVLFCIQDFKGIVDATYANNFTEYLRQLLGREGAVVVLSLLFIDSTCCCASGFTSAQRVTFAISRDGVLPFSKVFRKLNKKRVPVNAALLVVALGLVITCSVIGSSVAFSAITATATIATGFSYLIPIMARQTIGRKTFKPAAWHLGRYSTPIGLVAMLYIMFVFCVLLLPQEFPVTAMTLNYAPVAIGTVTMISLVGWILPFGLGGMHWFKGPKRTIAEIDARRAALQEINP